MEREKKKKKTFIPPLKKNTHKSWHAVCEKFPDSLEMQSQKGWYANLCVCMCVCACVWGAPGDASVCVGAWLQTGQSPSWHLPVASHSIHTPPVAHIYTYIKIRNGSRFSNKAQVLGLARVLLGTLRCPSCLYTVSPIKSDHGRHRGQFCLSAWEYF